MKKVIVAALALIMMLQTGIAEEAMDYRAIGSQARIFGTEGGAAITLLPGDEARVVCTVPERADVTVIGETAEGYVLVNYEGNWGYAYWEYIDMMSSANDASRKSVLPEDIAAVNGFISAFTKVQLAGSEWGSGEGITYSDVEKFAAYRLWLAGDECVEKGEYDGENDIRIPAEAIANAAAGYFDAGTLNAPAAGDYLYFDSSDFSAGPFAVVTDFSDLQDGKFVVRFNTYGAGSDWAYDCAALTADAAAEQYPEDMGYGYAIISASGYSDYVGYRLVDMIAVY
jgi:hypothetical protein